MGEDLEVISAKQFVIIDDDTATLFLCKAFISRAFNGKEITTYTNPEKAIEYFKTHFSQDPIETVVLLDINMPQMTGWEVLKEMSLFNGETKEKITILMLSSSIDPKDRQQARDHELVSGYLEKPLNIEMLKNLIASI